MIEPKKVDIKGRTFFLSKFPATAGYEIATQLPMQGIPKIGDFAAHQELISKLMCYVGVQSEGMDTPQMLTTQALVDNHTGDWETYALIVKEMMVYNCSFLTDGVIFNLFDDYAKKALVWISSTLTDLLAQSSPTEKQPLTN